MAGRSIATLPIVLLLCACGGEVADAEPASAAAVIRETASPSPPPVPSASPPTPAEAAHGRLELVLQFTSESFVQAVVDGGNRISELHIAGEEMRVEAEREIVLTIGNAGAVRATVNGRPYPLPEKAGEVVRDLVITAPAGS